MAGRKQHKGGKAKREPGQFVAFPMVCLRSPEFSKLSAHAVKLLCDLLAQYNGKNNGDLCAAWTLMAPHGWRSRATLSKSLKELLDSEWLIKTRQGGKHRASLYAVSFYSIDNCGGKLDVAATVSPPRTWRKSLPPMPDLTPTRVPKSAEIRELMDPERLRQLAR